MKYKVFAILFLLVVCTGCTSLQKEAAPITWETDDVEISLYIYINRDASNLLMEMLKNPVSFEQVSQFFVENSNGKIPFLVGSMPSAALFSRREEMLAEMEKKIAKNGLTIEIVGFKENPVWLMEGALDFRESPKYLIDFQTGEHPQVVDQLIYFINDSDFVVEIYGYFPEW